jgi:prevent-host-death family protein
MPVIGIRELKTKASQIIRNIRKSRTRYVVTVRGRPVAMLLPLDESMITNLASSAPTDDNWEELMRLGKRMAESWPPGVQSAEVLSELRR